jgi:hypothetical protein
MPGKPPTGQKPASLLGVDRKRFKRSRVTKSYSYRYEVARSVGPPGEPLVEAGCAIVSSRYCGRATSWNFSRGVLSTERYVVNATFVAPSPDNPMTYPPRPPRELESKVADTPVSEALPRVPIVPRYLPPPPKEEAELWNGRPRRADPAPPPLEEEAELWNDRPRRADPAPPPQKQRPEPGAHQHEPPPRIWR